ncbi:hypothetical protein [Butyrivibrio fibrisolvens]|uniref:ErpK protein n=1 Tax=Butyrivibrio fibrisolvens TaxID=831 RepID=A0A317G5B8_BUTFI|nr:hypothetical protein [Butyrivibrio fibrisolvens]PWT29254.1 hypothetical protein CPT75_20195 [Butyrivibrio fibrisolvens]
MARVMATDVLEQKIEKAQERVKRNKKAYDEAVRDLQKLLDKRTALRAEEFMKAIANSNRSYEEILNFITANDEMDEAV